jgi:16S rRNA (guanine527-N7)-methyltransferase
VNPVSGAPSLPATAGPDAAAERLLHDDPPFDLVRESGLLGVPLDPEAVARFIRYRDLLLDWNARLNLTAIRDSVEIERRLCLDAIALLPAIDRETASSRAAGRLVDVGSGAGFPGLALKIARPQLDVTLVDATAKKVGFLEEVIRDLGLTSTRAVHGRAEVLGQKAAFRESFTLATARAVAPLPVLLEFVMPLLDVGGVAFLPKGLAIDDELRRGKRAACTLGVEIVSADVLPVGATRLVIARKTTLTPPPYPRRTGVPSRSPLGGGS